MNDLRNAKVCDIDNSYQGANYEGLTSFYFITVHEFHCNCIATITIIKQYLFGSVRTRSVAAGV